MQDYYLNETKGFYCLRQLGCLKDGKGHKNITSVFSQDLLDKLKVRQVFIRLVNKTIKLQTETHKFLKIYFAIHFRLQDFFLPHNEAVSRLLNRTFDWE